MAFGISSGGADAESQFIALTGATQAPRAADGDAVLEGHLVEVKRASSATLNQVRATKYITLVVPSRWAPVAGMSCLLTRLLGAWHGSSGDSTPRILSSQPLCPFATWRPFGSLSRRASVMPCSLPSGPVRSTRDFMTRCDSSSRSRDDWRTRLWRAYVHCWPSRDRRAAPGEPETNRLDVPRRNVHARLSAAVPGRLSLA